MIIDTHAHLDLNDFDADRNEVIARAQENHVDTILTVGTFMEANRFSMDLAQKYEPVFASVGIHPHDSQEVTDENLAELRRMYQLPKVVAIGEIGLDYFKMYMPKDIQRPAFEKQVELALDLAAPIIIHDRDADDEILDMLSSIRNADWQGVFHCFPGDCAMAKKVLDLGFHISFTGVVTFKNFKAEEIVNYIPLERLLLETDCPFMAPVPVRGKRNEPSYLRFIAEKIASMRAIPVETLVRQTRSNTLALFSKMGGAI